MWPINSSKEEIILSRDSKALFVQRFVKVFDQNWKHVEAQIQRTDTTANFAVPWNDCHKQPPKVLYKKGILKNFGKAPGNTCVGVYFLKKLQTLRPVAVLKIDPITGVFLWILQNFYTTYVKKHLQTCKQLLFNFFNGSIWHGPKGLRSRLYDGVRLQCPSHKSSFCFWVSISRPEASPNVHSKT